MMDSGMLHFANGSVPLKPDSMSRALELASDPWEVKVVQVLSSWWSSLDTMEMKTSGSTGAPRLIQHSKSAMEASAIRTLQHFQLSPGARIALAMPAEFVGGMMMVIRAAVGSLGIGSRGTEVDAFFFEQYIGLCSAHPGASARDVRLKEAWPTDGSMEDVIARRSPCSVGLAWRVAKGTKGLRVLWNDGNDQSLCRSASGANSERCISMSSRD